MLLIIAIVLVSTLVLYLPFLFHFSSWLGLSFPDSNMSYIYKHWDGPLYIVPAKTWYDPLAIQKLGVELPLSPSYFAAHLPLYPFMIAVFAPVIGFLASMVGVNIAFTVLLALAFYFVVKRFELSQNPLILTGVLLFLPRLLVIRSVGAPETMFMFFVLVSLYCFEKKSYFFAGLLGGLAAMTKSPGILLFGAYIFVLAERFMKTKKIEWQSFGLLLIPLGTLAVFAIYQLRYNDFFAYFHSGDNIHLVSPFAVFNFAKRWVGTAWLEEIIFYYFMYLLALFTLWKSKYRSFFYFFLIFFVATLFIDHRDIARYSLPLWPLAVIAHEKFFTSRRFLIALLILLPALYLFAWNFLGYNLMPISNWQPYL